MQRPIRHVFTKVLTVTALALVLFPAAPLLLAQEKAAPQRKVGKIYVVGNDVTQDEVVLRTCALYPGQPFTEADLRAAEANLKKLGIFANGPNTSPSVEVIESKDSFGTYCDILIRVKESLTGSLFIGSGLDSRGNIVMRMTLEERNFDLRRVPTSLADVWEGRAFRGAGKRLKVDILRMTFPISSPVPSLLQVLSTSDKEH